MNILTYTARFLAFVLIQFVALSTLTLITIGPPIVIYEFFPNLLGFMRNWTNEVALFERIIGDIGFVALVGALGIAPYLFNKAADLVPTALRLIGIEYLAITRDDWLLSKSTSSALATVGELLARRRQGIANTIRASFSLLVSFALLSVALSWASLLVSPRSVDATIRIDGEVMLQSVVEGSEIEFNCINGSVPCGEFIVVSPRNNPQ